MSSDSETTIPEQFASGNILGGGDYYELLGVHPSADTDEIEARYRQLSRDIHPDHSDAPDAATRFSQLQEAKSVLLDDRRRWLYDHLGHDGYYRVTAGNDAGLDMQIQIVEREIERTDKYSPPAESMGPREKEPADPVPAPKTVALEQAVTEVLDDLSRTGDPSNQPTETGRDGARQPDARVSSVGRADRGLEGRNEAATDGFDDTGEQVRASEPPPETVSGRRLGALFGLIADDDGGRVTDPDIRHTARTVTTATVEELASVPASWDYWSTPESSSGERSRSPASRCRLLWTYRALVFAGMVGVTVGLSALGEPSVYPLAFLVLGTTGAGTSLWLTRRSAPGESRVNDPGLWRWPQSVGRLLVAFGALQVVFSVTSPWMAFAQAVHGTVSPGVWQPAAATAAVTRVFVLVTVGSLVLGTLLVALGVSWRLWVDRLAGGYVHSPAVFDAALTGLAAVVVVTPMQLVSGSPTAGAVPVALPSPLVSWLPGLVFLHVGFLAALGVGLLPSAYALRVSRAPRTAPVEETEPEHAEPAQSADQ